MNVVEIALRRKSELEYQLKKLETFLKVAEELQEWAAKKAGTGVGLVQAVEAASEPRRIAREPEPTFTSRSPGVPFSDPLFQQILAADRRRRGVPAQDAEKDVSEADGGKLAVNS